MNKGWGEDGESEKERALGVRLRHNPQLRLILKAAALAAASPTLKLKLRYKAARRKRHMSELLRCDGIPVAVKCASSRFSDCPTTKDRGAALTLIRPERRAMS